MTPAAHKENITAVKRGPCRATAARKAPRSNIPATSLPFFLGAPRKARSARPVRLLQLVLAAALVRNAEQHLADHLNVYLHHDGRIPDHYRETILRGLGRHHHLTPPPP